jgi:hypothetical protein
MPLIKVKLFQDDTLSALATTLAAYKAGAGSELLTSQRGSSMSAFKEADGDAGVMLALAHGGQDIPVAKFGDLEHVVARDTGTLAEIQAAVDAALANSVFKTVTDGNANAVPGSITSATMAFEAEDVGRKITIGTSERTITAYTSATEVVYSGAAITGTGLTVKLHGAEVLQDLELVAGKGKTGGFEATVMMALGGQLP